MQCYLNLNLEWEDARVRIIRMTNFLITGMCAGSLALLWALGVLYRHHKSRGRVSVIAVLLLLSDLLELILIPILVANMLYEHEMCGITSTLFFGARLCGQLLHQIVALESISQRYPSLINVCSWPCSFTVCIILFLLALGFQFLYFPGIITNISVCVFSVIVCGVTCLLTWKAPHEINQATDRKPGVLVLSVAMFTLIILHTPFFLTAFAGLPFMLDSLASLRLISDPLLCVLVCREFSSNKGCRITMDGSDVSPTISIDY